MKKFAFGLLPLVICVLTAKHAMANYVDSSDGSAGVYVAPTDCRPAYAQGFDQSDPQCNPTLTPYVPSAASQNNVVLGQFAAVFTSPLAVNPGEGQNVAIGLLSTAGVRVDTNGNQWNSFNSTAVGSFSGVYGLENTAIGAGATSYGRKNSAFGAGARTGFSLAFQPVDTQSSLALGANSMSFADYAVAVGADSVADEEYTVSFGSSAIKRRLLNVADGVGDYDAVNVRQMRAVTDAMATQISGLDFRVTALENAAPGGGGGPADLTPAYQYTDNSSAQTLNSANAYTDASSAQTLSSANAYTDISSAQTLNSANAYTDAAVAGVARESRAYTDQEIAKSEEFLSAGIAAVAAQPNLPALAAGQKAVAVGTGHYNGANAVGVAFGFAPRDGVVLSGGVSGVSGEGKPVFRTSASYVW